MVLVLHRLSTMRRRGVADLLRSRVIIHKMTTVRPAVRCAVCFGLRPFSEASLETFLPANIPTSQPQLKECWLMFIEFQIACLNRISLPDPGEEETDADDDDEDEDEEQEAEDEQNEESETEASDA